MPRELKCAGFDEIDRMIGSLESKAPEIASQALFVGAGVVADAVTEGIQSIVTEEFSYASKGEKRFPSPEEKNALLNATAIMRFKKDGFGASTRVYVSGGYADVNGRQKPVPLIANAINSGTSFMQKQPFFRKAVSRSKDLAYAAMKKKVEELI